MSTTTSKTSKTAKQPEVTLSADELIRTLHHQMTGQRQAMIDAAMLAAEEIMENRVSSPVVAAAITDKIAFSGQFAENVCTYKSPQGKYCGVIGYYGKPTPEGGWYCQRHMDLLAEKPQVIPVQRLTEEEYNKIAFSSGSAAERYIDQLYAEGNAKEVYVSATGTSQHKVKLLVEFDSWHFVDTTADSLKREILERVNEMFRELERDWSVSPSDTCISEVWYDKRNEAVAVARTRREDLIGRPAQIAARAEARSLGGMVEFS